MTSKTGSTSGPILINAEVIEFSSETTVTAHRATNWPSELPADIMAAAALTPAQAERVLAQIEEPPQHPNCRSTVSFVPETACATVPQTDWHNDILDELMDDPAELRLYTRPMPYFVPYKNEYEHGGYTSLADAAQYFPMNKPQRVDESSVQFLVRGLPEVFPGLQDEMEFHSELGHITCTLTETYDYIRLTFCMYKADHHLYKKHTVRCVPCRREEEPLHWIFGTEEQPEETLPTGKRALKLEE